MKEAVQAVEQELLDTINKQESHAKVFLDENDDDDDEINTHVIVSFTEVTLNDKRMSLMRPLSDAVLSKLKQIVAASHPDKHNNDADARRRFEAKSKAFEGLKAGVKAWATLSLIHSHLSAAHDAESEPDNAPSATTPRVLGSHMQTDEQPD